LFVLTAILTRASKRYQWSRKRPLNAANQNYYVAPVFYEWNVFDLFERKGDAVRRSDDYIRSRLRAPAIAEGTPDLPEVPLDFEYVVGSATQLGLPDGSIDYVFTDPPFGSNIFYSDMNLFHEAWLGRLTDDEVEAVVDRSGTSADRRTAERYERLLESAFRECFRVLKPHGWLSLVFSNSTGRMWAVVQRATARAGFRIDPAAISVLDKGQRSVKGLASGFENVVTADLVLSMEKAEPREGHLRPPPEPFPLIVARMVHEAPGHTPTDVYLHAVREFIRNDWDAERLDVHAIGEALREAGFVVDPRTARLDRAA
jgi:hypothetical protein